MMHADTPPVRREWVTKRGLEMLDELVGALQESQLALRSMRVDVGLTLDELERDLRTARESARLAYDAASLLSQGAELAGSWSDHPSRPKAVLARHRVAVDYGAPMKVPATPAADLYGEILRESYERMLQQARESQPEPPCASRRCGHPKLDGKLCRRRLVRIRPNEFANHCPDHLEDSERELYECHRRQAASAIAQAQREEFRRIADEWVAERHGIRSWVERVIRSTGWVD
jgi:hypothetical protein